MDSAEAVEGNQTVTRIAAARATLIPLDRRLRKDILNRVETWNHGGTSGKRERTTYLEAGDQYLHMYLPR